MKEKVLVRRAIPKEGVILAGTRQYKRQAGKTPGGSGGGNCRGSKARHIVYRSRGFASCQGISMNVQVEEGRIHQTREKTTS